MEQKGTLSSVIESTSARARGAHARWRTHGAPTPWVTSGRASAPPPEVQGSNVTSVVTLPPEHEREREGARGGGGRKRAPPVTSRHELFLPSPWDPSGINDAALPDGAKIFRWTVKDFQTPAENNQLCTLFPHFSPGESENLIVTFLFRLGIFE